MTDRELLQQALDALETHAKQYPHMSKGYTVDAVQAIRTRLAQPEPEPVAVWELQEDGWDTIADRDWMESLPIGTMLYTAPPKKEWEGLTDEEKSDIDAKSIGIRSAMYLTEAKLKEKNSD
jgi:hypothetical protein